MMDIGTMRAAKERERLWRERYRAASPAEKRVMLAERAHERETWDAVLEWVRKDGAKPKGEVR